MKKIALSGIQTSGSLHLGNYLGSIKNWLKMQDEYNCFFFLADLHAITSENAYHDLRESIIKTIATYIACGLDPNKSVIFLQSAVQEHCELAWILNCITPIGWLKRMTQFKEKSGKNQDNASIGLFTYPVLMAADILLYKADVVPVGDDQKQHLELTRDIAGVINRKFDKDVFTIPEPLTQGIATRVMSLRDGTKKMSKSDPSSVSRIHINDNPDEIMQKLKKSKTDGIPEITYDPKKRPEVSNLINIFSALSDISVNEILSKYQGQGFAKFKSDLAEIIIEEFRQINFEYTKLLQDYEYLKKTLHYGVVRARTKAKPMLDEVKTLFGLL